MMNQLTPIVGKNSVVGGEPIGNGAFGYQMPDVNPLQTLMPFLLLQMLGFPMGPQVGPLGFPGGSPPGVTGGPHAAVAPGPPTPAGSRGL